MKRDDIVPVFLRVPSDMKQWLMDEANRNYSSVNSEIVRCIRLRIKAEERNAA